MRRTNPRSYDEYLKAYSMAMLPRAERENVSYGGKSTRHRFSPRYTSQDLIISAQLSFHHLHLQT